MLSALASMVLAFTERNRVEAERCDDVRHHTATRMKVFALTREDQHIEAQWKLRDSEHDKSNAARKAQFYAKSRAIGLTCGMVFRGNTNV